jgi:rubrerythrin
MQRTFSSLTPPEALQAAICIEQRNAEVYHRFAEMFTEFGDEESVQIASLFWEMAIEERRHRSLLEEKYLQAYGPLTGAFTEEKLLELIEVPKLDAASLFTGGDGIAPRDRALYVALQAEVSAQQFYERLVNDTPEGPLRRLYKDLAEMEDGHLTYLESKLAEDMPGKQTVH